MGKRSWQPSIRAFIVYERNYMQRTFASVLAVAQVSSQPNAVGVYTLTTDRLWASAAAVLALTGVIIGGLALARVTGRIRVGDGRIAATVALVMGLIGVIIGGPVLATADGGPGTGNGIVGAVMALVLGLIAMTVGGLALARSRRTA
jgi:Family of unknown function (DUF6223)